MVPATTSEPLTDEELDELIALDDSVGDGDGGENLDAFIRRISPRKPPPPHLAPLIAEFERARRERVRLCISLPPRHAKTTLVQHAIAWWLSRSPADTCGYFSYSDRQGWSKSRRARDLAEAAGVQLAVGAESVSEWRTPDGGGLISGGAGGGLTGQGITGFIVVDDPYKNREEADSGQIREKVWEWFNEVAFTRLEDASIIVLHTRWHEDDLIGRLAKDPEWKIINLPALAEEGDPLGRSPGDALWPDHFSADELQAIRTQIGEFSFAALYQGHPRPRGHRVFGEAHYYDPASTDLTGCRIFIGADPAATEKTTADHGAMVALYVKGTDLATMTVYVREVYSAQVEIPQYVDDLRAFQARHGSAKASVEAVGGFKAIPQMLKRLDPKLRVVEAPVVGDKFTRAQAVAAAWNDGRVLLPLGAPWLVDFLAVVSAFTGVNDARDDEVDALAHAYNSITPAASVKIHTAGDRRAGR